LPSTPYLEPGGPFRNTLERKMELDGNNMFSRTTANILILLGIQQGGAAVKKATKPKGTSPNVQGWENVRGYPWQRPIREKPKTNGIATQSWVSPGLYRPILLTKSVPETRGRGGGEAGYYWSPIQLEGFLGRSLLCGGKSKPPGIIL